MTWIKPDTDYKLRNGDRVTVIGPTTIKYGRGGRQEWHGLKGKHADGRELIWEPDGRADKCLGEHPFDIVKRWPTKAPKAKAKK